MNKPLFAVLVAGLPVVSSFAQTVAPAAPPAGATVTLPASPPAGATVTLPASIPGPNQKLKDEQERLLLENSISEQKLKAQLAQMAAEKQRLEAESGLALQKQAAELAALKAQIEAQTQEAASIRAKLALEDARRDDALASELAALRTQLAKKRAENDLAAAQMAAKSQELTQRTQEADARMKELQAQRSEFDMQVAKFNNEIDLWEKREDWKNRVSRQIEYTKDPYKDGVLTVSDRRIALNGPIMMDTADYVCERIDYFNNQNPENPIFIVIDSSPGGSVMAGYRILKAMDGSPAPVYVVVKSFAASMAAGITTMAKKSYAYPNAIILHHQLASGVIGNLTQQRESVKQMEEWWKRLATPVARKMGLTLDEFVKKMYENTSTGDWREFADQAKQLKWVDQIVETIREESMTKNPDTLADRSRRQPMFPYLKEETDSDGRRFRELPRLEPFDCYYLYDPEGYYRLAK